MRMRLHSSAAYVRKFAQLDDVRNPTTVSHGPSSTNHIDLFTFQAETTIYTMCHKCRKPLLHAHHAKSDDKPNGGFAYCNNCLAPATICSIW